MRAPVIFFVISNCTYISLYVLERKENFSLDSRIKLLSFNLSAFFFKNVPDRHDGHYGAGGPDSHECYHVLCGPSINGLCEKVALIFWDPSVL